MKKTATLLLLIFLIGLILPEENKIPVKGATLHDWNHQSFWFYPWGNNRVHKGIDIFAHEGTQVIAPTGGLILFSGNISLGGNVIYMIGPKWRFHYFAHLDTSSVNPLSWVNSGDMIGTVGSTGNAKGKAPHLHYSIKSLFPRVWRYNSDKVFAWSRLFYINPSKFLQEDEI